MIIDLEETPDETVPSEQNPRSLQELRQNMLPPSSLLDRLNSFLPMMRESNDILIRQLQSGELKPEDVDPEAVDEENGDFVEMDVGVGVFEENANEEENHEIIIPGMDKPGSTPHDGISIISSNEQK
ncbi:hypothetical protein BLNAU_6251 [Blattamonas nauphoetae]|uniref:Uncharacterized protein n=1 Tax=Blattamonas nauphoetae TaxID=2049346 RepID=A0ABQ9Y4W9_9EUKA|nr:hypothetical protein BLNAU_6251 [Blattamonas nauphoetae]